MIQLKKILASVLIASTALLGMPSGAWATGMVTTDEAITAQASSANRDKVESFFLREDVQRGLQEQGVNSQAAQDRVKAMSDAEVAQLAGRIDQAPAGGDVLGVLFTIFIVLLITDILGLTKIFPFTRSVR